MSRFLWFLVLTVCAAAQPPRALQVDVVAMPGLAAADFELTVDGAAKPISSVKYVEQRPRRVVMVVDDTVLSVQSVDRVRAALSDFVDQQMQADDEAAILHTRSGSGMLQSITSDRRVLHNAIEQLRFAPQVYGAAGIAVTLRRAMAGLRSVAGRKAVVLISENLAAAERHPDLFEGLGALAADASTVFYTVDPRDPANRTEPGILPLAGDTGGLNLGSELPKALARVLQDAGGYYLVGCGECAGSALAKTEVRIKTSAAQCRFRSVPLGSGIPEQDYRARTLNQDLATALNSPFAAGAIRVQVTPLFGNSNTQGSVVTTLVWVDVGALTFTHQLDGLHKASGEVVASAYRSTGMSADTKGASFTLNLTSEEYEKALQQGWLYRMDLQASKPDTYQVRAAVRDEASGRMGTADQLVEVPDLTGGGLVLSGIAIHKKDSTNVDASGGRRIFAPGDILTFVYQILNPYRDAEKPTELETQLHLFRGNVEAFTGKPQILEAKALEDPKRRPVTGEVTLGGKMTAGTYHLQITMADVKSEKARRTQQWIDFEVRR